MRSMEPDRGRKSLARRGSETGLPISPYSRPRTPMPKGLSEILVYACIAALIAGIFVMVVAIRTRSLQ